MRVASICVSGLLLAVGFVLSMGVIVVAALFMVNGIHFGVGSACRLRQRAVFWWLRISRRRRAGRKEGLGPF